MHILLKYKKYKQMKKLIKHLNKQVESQTELAKQRLSLYEKSNRESIDVMTRAGRLIDYISETYSIDKNVLRDIYKRGEVNIDE